jgi:hypothetical protein
MKTPLVNAVCAHHPQVGAVDICSRCGAFLCGECALYVREVVPACAACKPLLELEGPASRLAWLSPPLSAAGLALLLAGLFVDGLDGLCLWAAAHVPGAGGLALSVRELLRINRKRAPRRGRWLARLGLGLGVVFALLAAALAVAFALFLTRG